MWTAQRWLQFVEARAATTITNVNWSANDETLTFTATLPTGAEAHTLLVPGTFGSDTVAAVAVDGVSVTAPSLVVNGRTMRAITLTAGAAAQRRGALRRADAGRSPSATSPSPRATPAPPSPTCHSRCRRRRRTR